jgi:hypothetical protein
LKRIESQVFGFFPPCPVILSTILFVAHDAHPNLSQLTFPIPISLRRLIGGAVSDFRASLSISSEF